MEEHLVPFPELIGSTKHDIKQHMSGCKVVRLPTAAAAGVWNIYVSALKPQRFYGFWFHVRNLSAVPEKIFIPKLSKESIVSFH